MDFSPLQALRRRQGEAEMRGGIRPLNKGKRSERQVENIRGGLSLSELEDAWYRRIEPGVRELVRHLRNRGFNTVCSCEHEMLIQIACDAEDLQLLRDVLCEFHGESETWEIHFFWQSWHRFAEVRLPMPNGKPNPGWSGARDWAGYPYRKGKGEK